MAIIQCRECGKEVSSEAKACPYCGAKPSKGLGIGALVLIIGAVVLIGNMVTPGGGAAPVGQSGVNDMATSALGACMTWIKQSLHDPSSAEFMDSSSANATEQDGVWTVIRAVRAKNAFNSTRLGMFECKMRSAGGDWILLSVKQLEN